jgi:hypothetical protein
MAIFRVASDMQVSGNISLVGPEPKKIDVGNGAVSASYFSSSAATGGFIGDGSALTKVTASYVNDLTQTKLGLVALSASSYISASKFVGDGSELTNLPEPTSIFGGYVVSVATSNANLKVNSNSAGAAQQGAVTVDLVASPTFTNVSASILSASGDTYVGGKLVVAGNLEVKGVITGSMTKIDANDLVIKDAQIIIASGSADKNALQTVQAGIVIGDAGAGVSVLFDGTNLSSSVPLKAPSFVGSFDLGTADQSFKGSVILSGSAKVVDKTDVATVSSLASWTDSAITAGDYVSGKFVITAKKSDDSAFQCVEMLALSGTTPEVAVYGELYRPATTKLFTVDMGSTGPTVTNISDAEIKVHVHRVYTKF